MDPLLAICARCYKLNTCSVSSDQGRQKKQLKQTLNSSHITGQLFLHYVSYRVKWIGRKGVTSPLHTEISYISWPCFVFQFSVFQGQWPSEIAFLKTPAHSMWVRFTHHTETGENKREATSEQGWRVTGLFVCFKVKKLGPWVLWCSSVKETSQVRPKYDDAEGCGLRCDRTYIVSDAL